jgi:2,4-dienoyl-CoA reductase-like NADH-dependent reductase (Old Yellow Enzyme family)
MTAEYYAQRATAGLMVSEGLPVSAQARGYALTPGIYTEEQVIAWRRVTAAVHDRSGRIFAQLWHCGRIGHRSLRADATPQVGPGNTAADSKTFVCDPKNGKPVLVSCDEPRQLETGELGGIVEDFVKASRRAMMAGFDGVEIHGANGYLFDQFRCPVLNQRTDAYGGSLENRCRLLLETTAAVAAAIGGARVGVRLSPLGQSNDMRPDPEPLSTYGYLARELDKLAVGYLHLNDQSGTWIHDMDHPLRERMRNDFRRTLILCGSFDGPRAEAALRSRMGDLIAFGRPYVSNPDLVERLMIDHELTPCDSELFYAGGPVGYVDYLPMTSSASQSPLDLFDFEGMRT